MLTFVDDNRDAAETPAMIVELAGHEVHRAHDGAAAVQMARRREPDVVFLDIGMPGMNGYEAAAKLRAGFDIQLTRPVVVRAVESLLLAAKAQNAH